MRTANSGGEWKYSLFHIRRGKLLSLQHNFRSLGILQYSRAFRVLLYLITLWNIRNKLKLNRFRHHDVLQSTEKEQQRGAQNDKSRMKQENNLQEQNKCSIGNRTKDFWARKVHSFFFSFIWTPWRLTLKRNEKKSLLFIGWREAKPETPKFLVSFFDVPKFMLHTLEHSYEMFRSPWRLQEHKKWNKNLKLVEKISLFRCNATKQNDPDCVRMVKSAHSSEK